MVVFHMHKSGICVCLGIAVAILPANCLLSVILHPAAIQESQFIPLPNDSRLMVPAAFFTSMPCASISVLSCSSLFSTLVEVRFPCGHTSSFNRALIFSSCLLTCFSHTNVYRFALLSILVPSTTPRSARYTLYSPASLHIERTNPQTLPAGYGCPEILL